MFLLTKPNETRVSEFRRRASQTDFSYPYIGQTRQGFRKSAKHRETLKYDIDHNCIPIGTGIDAFESAKAAFRQWKMFDLNWVTLHSTDTPISEGEIVVIEIRHFGFFSLNAAKIVYTIDEWDRFGFAYGTLAEHGEIGEERFSVRLDRKTKEVVYDLYAFSRPGHTLAKLAYPLTRKLQKRFVYDTQQAMLRAVRDNRIN